MFNSKKVLKTALLASSLALSTISVADIAIIVNPASSASSLDGKDLKRIYLGNTFALPDGSAVKLSDLAFGNALREQFYLKCCDISAQQARSRWAGVLFSGAGKPPTELASDKEVLAWVAGNKDAMGYVDSASVDASVKSVMVLK